MVALLLYIEKENADILYKHNIIDSIPQSKLFAISE